MTQRSFVLLITLMTGFLLVCVGFRASCAVFDDTLCGNTVLRSVRSPDSSFDAVIFNRGCGATTGYDEQVSLIPVGSRLPNEASDIFVADSDHGAAPKGPEVQVVWESNTSLLIRYHPKARIFHQAKQIRIKQNLFHHRLVTLRYETK